jgi:hypothetical protein
VACVSRDQWLTLDEFEVFRVVASSLDLPVPPVLPGRIEEQTSEVLGLNRQEDRAMKNWNRVLGRVVLLLLGTLVMHCGCDSGEKALDEVTGNRAVKQYHKSKKDLEKITDQQSERLKRIPGEEKEEEK